jgi:hypothetical protein
LCLELGDLPGLSCKLKLLELTGRRLEPPWQVNLLALPARPSVNLVTQALVMRRAALPEFSPSFPRPHIDNQQPLRLLSFVNPARCSNAPVNRSTGMSRPFFGRLLCSSPRWPHSSVMGKSRLIWHLRAFLEGTLRIVIPLRLSSRQSSIRATDNIECQVREEHPLSTTPSTSTPRLPPLH